MNNYMVIAKVNGIEYLTKVEAETSGGAEHKILDEGYCGYHAYSVEACMAFDAKAMKTDTFIYSTISATPIGLEALVMTIQIRNKQIKKLDEAERRLKEIDKQMKELEKEKQELAELLSK